MVCPPPVPPLTISSQSSLPITSSSPEKVRGIACPHSLTPLIISVSRVWLLWPPPPQQTLTLINYMWCLWAWCSKQLSYTLTYPMPVLPLNTRPPITKFASLSKSHATSESLLLPTSAIQAIYGTSLWLILGLPSIITPTSSPCLLTPKHPSWLPYLSLSHALFPSKVALPGWKGQACLSCLPILLCLYCRNPTWRLCNYPKANFWGPPAVLPPSPESPELCSSPTDIHCLTIDYFQGLFTRQPRPPVNKPWLSTLSVTVVADCVCVTLFQWPQPLALQDLRHLLSKGNCRPCPSPDRWEKWQVKALSDSFLSIVITLINYLILTSHFPASVKPSTLSSIHKCGSPADLTNYWGVCCSNLLMNLAYAWLNHRLMPYVARLQIIPPGQVTTQPGVQGRDLLSFWVSFNAGLTRQGPPSTLYAMTRWRGLTTSNLKGSITPCRLTVSPIPFLNLTTPPRLTCPIVSRPHMV